MRIEQPLFSSFFFFQIRKRMMKEEDKKKGQEEEEKSCSVVPDVQLMMDLSFSLGTC
jgi:hypothetical protein